MRCTFTRTIAPVLALAVSCVVSAAPQGAIAPPVKPALPDAVTAPVRTPGGRSLQKGVDQSGTLSTGAEKPAIREAADDAAAGRPVGSSPAPIRFDPPTLDLGEMQPDVPKPGKIKLVNTGTEEVRILKAIPGCGCTTAGWPKDPIPAGGFAEVEITLKPGPKQGQRLSKKVTFQVEGHAPILLTVEGTVAEYIHLSPDIIDAPTPEKPSEGAITLTSKDGTPFKLVGSNPDILVEKSFDAKTEQVVHVDWKRWEELGRGIKLTLNTDHPKSPNLSLIVKRAIKAGSEVTPPTPSNQARPINTLVTAARVGDVNRVKLELANGTDVNSPDPASGRTALMWAARENKVEVIPVLLEAKAALEAKDRVGKAPLALAAENGALEAATLLLAAGADVNARDNLQGSALLWAAGLGTPATVRLMLDKGAEINIRDSNGMTPLLWSAGIGNPETVAVLLERKPDLTVADNVTGDTALMRAVRSGKAESVSLLIAAGADVNVHNQRGETPILIAAATGGAPKVKLLLDAKADTSVKNLQGMSVAEIAGRRSDPEAAAVIALLGGTPAPIPAPQN